MCESQGGDEGEERGQRRRKKNNKKTHEEARFTQGDLCWFSLFVRASGVRLAGSCCTATVTRVTSLRRLSSAASRCLGIRTFRTGAKDDKVHTFHPHLLRLICDGGEVTGRDSSLSLSRGCGRFSLHVSITIYKHLVHVRQAKGQEKDDPMLNNSLIQSLSTQPQTNRTLFFF